MSIAQRIIEDFEYDLSISQFAFQDIIRNNEGYRKQLLAEFTKLSPEPKLHWYFREFIPDEVWAKNCMENKGPVRSSADRSIVAANFIADTPIDTQASDVIAKFEELKRRNKVPLKYYGRFLIHTETVKVLDRVNSEIDLFRKYVLHNPDASGYADFSKAAGRRLARLLKTISIDGLGLELKNYFLKVSTDDDLRMLIFFMNVKDVERSAVMERFKILKVLADEVIIEEFSSGGGKVGPSDTSGKLASTSSQESNLIDFQSQFKEPLQYHEVLRKLVTSGRVRRSPNTTRLILVPTRKNASYEAVTIFEAANELGYLRRRDYRTAEIREILSNTFQDWKLSERTVRDFKSRNKIDDYMTIIR